MKALIAGGAGFVGSNYACHLLDGDWEVIVYDNYARGVGCEKNVEWLKDHPNSRNLGVIKADVRDNQTLFKYAKDCDLIVHAAAQVSVPLSTANPRTDFEVNAVGTFNVLEAARNAETNAVVIYTSTNKVYGMPDVELVELETRYDFKDLPEGVDERFPLKGEEPYGVSKAIGDHYIRAYYLRYGLRAVSLRCSCMYGPRQWGKEEQGWVAWFCIAAALGKTITIFGDGKQVRDLLYIDDVIRLFDLSFEKIDNVAGQGLNIGGGRKNSASLLEVLAFLEELTGRKVPLRFTDWRPGDNKCYYSNCTKAKQLLGWEPTTPWREGVRRTYEWVLENIEDFRLAYAHLP